MTRALNFLDSFLIVFGFLGATFISTSEIGRVYWPPYCACVAVAMFGLVRRYFRRRTARRSEHVGSDIAAVERGLTVLVERLQLLQRKRSDPQASPYDISRAIDADLRDPLNEVAEARDALIPRFGMQRYADLMTQFAGAERMVNRAWSASTDGYIDEVWRSLERAAQQMEKAATLLRDYQQPRSSG